MNIQSCDQISRSLARAIASAWASCESLAFHATCRDWHEDDMQGGQMIEGCIDLDVRQLALKT